ncbi:MAG: tetratricopeptide repeat protein, partial [bacterium]|nr:tetratricopeptide repeat protein [bacterium]
PAQLKLADTLLGLGRLDEAGAMYEKAVEHERHASAAHYGLGKIHSSKGDSAAAAKAYRRAVELVPEFGGAHYALALAYRRLGQPEKAKPHFQAYEKHKLTIPPANDPLTTAVRRRNMGALDLVQPG